MEFEGFEGLTTAPSNEDVFAARKGVNATPAPGNGSLPPGATETPDHTKRTPSVTKRDHLKKVGD